MMHDLWYRNILDSWLLSYLWFSLPTIWSFIELAGHTNFTLLRQYPLPQTILYCIYYSTLQREHLVRKRRPFA